MKKNQCLITDKNHLGQKNPFKQKSEINLNYNCQNQILMNNNKMFCAQQCFELISQYYHQKGIVKINKQVNSHQILTINTSITKQIEEIQQDYNTSTNPTGKCLKRRCIKLLNFFDDVKNIDYQKQYEWKPSQIQQLTKFQNTNNLIYSNAIINELKIGKKVQSNIKKDTKQIIQQTKFAQISQFSKPINQINSSQSSRSLEMIFKPISIQYNQTANKKQLIKQNKKTLNLGKIINIHQILKANRQDRLNDFQKQKQNYEFQNRIQKSLMQIHKDLKQIKQNQICNQQSLSQLRIEQLQNQIKKLNLKRVSQPLTPPNVTRIIKLDSVHIKKSDKLKKQTGVTFYRNDKKRNNSETVLKTQRIDSSKSSYCDASRRNYWNRSDYSNKLKNQQISKKIIINENKNSIQSIEKMKKSINSLSNKTAKNKYLLSSRIAKIYNN